MKIYKNDKFKLVRSESYNYNFDKRNGFFMRWGKDKEDDPSFSLFGPEIADIEISTICHGIGKPCSWCYKSNTPKGINMSFEAFKKVFQKLPENLTQIAFGLGDIDANPDLFKMFEHCKLNGVIPNTTINGYNLTDEYADKFAHYCGAIAVSHYSDEICFGAIEKLQKRGLKQVNIHKLLAEETYEDCIKLIDKAIEDSRLKDLNAIVFLLLKPKGKRNTFHPMKSVSNMRHLIDYAKEKNIVIGFDSCSSTTVLKAMEDSKEYKMFQTFVEPCESFHFSIYINAECKVFPCSFLEGEEKYKSLDILDTNDFINDIWMSEEAKSFRKNMKIDKLGNRMCPHFDLYEE